MLDINLILALAVLAMTCVYSILFLLWYNAQKELRRTKESLKYFEETFHSTSGSALGFGDFDLITLDGGKHWWNITRTNEGTVVNGPANPKLLAHIKGLEDLYAYALKNGPIGSRPITEEDIKVLQNADFEVRR